MVLTLPETEKLTIVSFILCTDNITIPISSITTYIPIPINITIILPNKSIYGVKKCQY